MVKVSVIIPCFNQGEYLDDAVDSVLAQTFQDIEIIIINDGSTDDFTNEKLKDYDKPKTRVIYTENQGLAAARNNGIQHSNASDYVFPLDADDKVEPTFIEKAVKILDIESHVGFVTSYVKFFGLKSEVVSSSKDGGSELFVLHHNNNVACAVIRKIIWIQAGGYDETLLHGFEDWDFWLKVTGNGWKVKIIKEPLYRYRIKNDSMWGDAEKVKPMLMKELVKRNGIVYSQHLVEAIFDRENIIFDLKSQLNHSNSYFQSRSFKFYLKLLKIKRQIFKLFPSNV